MKVLIEIGEEMGSPGLHEVCATHKELLRADVLIGSDGPRMAPTMPTIFGGSRGVVNFDLKVDLREGGHHSGNWGGLLANPGVILAHAMASLVDKNGRYPGAGAPTSRHPPLGARGPGRVGSYRRGRSRARPGLGRARPVAGRKGLWLQHAGGPGLHLR